MRLLGVVVAALIWAVTAFTGTAAAASDRHVQVLLLYAESRLAPAIVAADTAFRSTLASSYGAPVDFRTEFLDLPPTLSADYERHLRDLLRFKYRDLHLDLIMALAPRALRIALDYRADLAPGVPIVFAGVDSVDDFELPSDVTGVRVTPGWMDTLEAALRLQPETRRVVVVGGTAPLDKRWLAAARAAYAVPPAHLEFTYLTDLPLDAVATKLAALPDGTIVLLIGFLRAAPDEASPL